MRRYLLFCGDNYYPMGGMKDFVGSFDSIEKFEYYMEVQRSSAPDWYQLFDTKTETIVREL